MLVSIPYGKSKLSVDICKDFSLITKEDCLCLTDWVEKFKDNLCKKINSFKDRSIGIAIPDITRYNISSKVLPLLIDEFRKIDVREVKIIIGSGLHRAASQEDIKSLIPPFPMKVKVISHNPFDVTQLVYVGETIRGTPILINRHFIESDVKIVIGTIEPHQFAGFTGGAKGVVIGLGGYETIKSNHALLREPNARLGVLEGNPVREDIDEAGEIAGIDLMINCVLNERKEIIDLFIGDINREYRRGVELVKQISTVKSPEVDIAIVSPGGFPKDIDMYQSQKALSHAEPIVRDGGIIILTAECCEGTGNNSFYRTMSSARSPNEIMETFTEKGFEIGPHKAFLLARTLERVKVFIVSKLDEVISRNLFMVPFSTVEDALTEALKELGKDSKIAIIPNATSLILTKEEKGEKRD